MNSKTIPMHSFSPYTSGKATLHPALCAGWGGNLTERHMYGLVMPIAITVQLFEHAVQGLVISVRHFALPVWHLYQAVRHMYRTVRQIALSVRHFPQGTYPVRLDQKAVRKCTSPSLISIINNHNNYGN